MKKLYLLTLFLLAGAAVAFSQNVPMGIKYQAVARDLDGSVIANKAISLRISLRSAPVRESNMPGGEVYYSETHYVRTNSLGLFDLTVGEGNTLERGLFDVPWSEKEIWMEIAIDETGGNRFKTINSSRLLAVPYAFHAGTAGGLSPLEDGLRGYGSYCSTNGGVPSLYWDSRGNCGTNVSKHKLGTTDNMDLSIVTNNMDNIRIYADGNVKVRRSLHVGAHLDVDSTAELNKVAGGTIIYGPTHVKNTLEVDLHTELNSTLNVDGATTLKSTLDVTSGATFRDNIFVHGSSHLDGPVDIVANPALSGADTNPDVYPLHVSGSNQGVWVKVNANPATNGNNWMTFEDDGGVKGRIEGATTAEIASNPVNANIADIWYNLWAYWTAEAVGWLLVPPQGPISTGFAAANMNKQSDFLTAIGGLTPGGSGVAYASGGADYAEWLEKAVPEERFSFGDIVGVKGGKVSKAMENADHYMVVSRNPAVIGNMPEDEKRHLFEKIGFMGQVVAKVKGNVNIGDYIIASELNDGFGIAVSPEDITLEQYKRIVGVAWSAAKGDKVFSMINVAIGINANDTALKLIKQQQQIDGIVSYLKSKDPSFDASTFASVPQNPSLSTQRAPETYSAATGSNIYKDIVTKLESNPAALNEFRANLKSMLDSRGIDDEQLRRIVNDDKYLINYFKELGK